MNAKLIAPLSLAFLLAACAGNAQTNPSHTHSHEHEHAHHHVHEHHHDMMANASFECENGATVKVSSAGTDKVRIAVDTIGEAVTLSQAVSGSGERYISNNGFYNKATEWHQKGKMAHLTFNDPYGNKVETACQAK